MWRIGQWVWRPRGLAPGADSGPELQHTSEEVDIVHNEGAWGETMARLWSRSRAPAASRALLQSWLPE